jgi:hypothetical protein
MAAFVERATEILSRLSELLVRGLRVAVVVVV